MEKEFVPYEQALELKELGFDEPCFGFYRSSEDILPTTELITRISSIKNLNNRGMRVEVLTPTFSQSFKFLREKYNLIFQINYLFNGNYQVVIHKNTHEYMVLIQDLKAACVYEIPDNYSYEEAELACLNKLIEIVK